jgi:hypothetical protein
MVSKAITTGALLAGVSWWLYAVIDGPTKLNVIGLIFFAGTLIAWLAFLIGPRLQTKRHALTTVQPEIPPEKLHLSIFWNDGHSGIFRKIGVSEDQVIDWCLGAHLGKSLGEVHWCGNGNVFSKPKYLKFRDLLISDGFIRQKGEFHTSGYELTGKGKALCREVYRRAAPTPQSAASAGFIDIANHLRARE